MTKTTNTIDAKLAEVTKRLVALEQGAYYPGVLEDMRAVRNEGRALLGLEPE